jgi:hypothetical protein
VDDDSADKKEDQLKKALMGLHKKVLSANNMNVDTSALQGKVNFKKIRIEKYMEVIEKMPYFWRLLYVNLIDEGQIKENTKELIYVFVERYINDPNSVVMPALLS